MKPTGGIARIDAIKAFRRLIVALSLLGRQATAAKRYRIGFYDPISTDQEQFMILLEYQDAVNRRLRRSKRG